MDKKAGIPNRIKELRLGLDWTQEKLAQESGFTQPEIARWEKSERPISDTQLAEIADALGCDIAELYAKSRVDGTPRKVPVVGKVGAGAEMHPYDDHAKGDGLEHVDAPGNVNPDKAVALEVEGDSMMPLIDDGDLIFYDERVFGVPDEWLGKICVVKVVDGATLVKRIYKGTRVGLYRLVCIRADALDREEEIEWSAKVKDIRQR